MSKEFKPYIPADRVLPEITKTSVIMGVLLAVVFGAANAYLGLRVGLTVSASIPAAVISMGIIRMILKRDSILENNIVQTMGSAGESVASGCIFTLPVLFIWAKEGITEEPSLFTITVIALCGGFLGADSVVFIVMAGAVTGLAWGLFRYIIIRKKEWSVPYGPFLGLGALAWMVFGNWFFLLFGK